MPGAYELLENVQSEITKVVATKEVQRTGLLKIVLRFIQEKLDEVVSTYKQEDEKLQQSYVNIATQLSVAERNRDYWQGRFQELNNNKPTIQVSDSNVESNYRAVVRNLERRAGGLSQEEMESIKSNRKIDAIKAYRSRTGARLLQSKLVIEAFMANEPGQYDYERKKKDIDQRLAYRRDNPDAPNYPIVTDPFVDE